MITLEESIHGGGGPLGLIPVSELTQMREIEGVLTTVGGLSWFCIDTVIDDCDIHGGIV